MFVISVSLFQSKNKKNPSGNSVEDEPVEKKKCKGCLRRVDLEYVKCPYCDSSEFYCL